MKKILFALTLLLCFDLEAQDKPLVVASASIMADMAMNIGGELIEVKTIVPIGGDPHIYEATPRDARLVEKADLIIVNGLTFEGWINELIENSGTNAPVVTITEGIEPIESATYENSSDPHAWMDPVFGKIYADNILKALIRTDPEHEEEFKFNHQVYHSQIDDLIKYCLEKIESIPEQQRILITSHDAFQYYGRRFGLRLEAILGTSTDAEAQTSDIQRVGKLIDSAKVPAVFIESTINPKLLQQIADDHHVVIGGQLYSDSISDKDGPASSYLDMVRHNTDVIATALSKAGGAKADSGQEGTDVTYWYLLILLVPVVIFFIYRMVKSST